MPQPQPQPQPQPLPSIGEPDSAKKPKRVRERSICEIVKAVAIWRRLYSGIIRNGGDVMIRYSLDDAARKVGMSKKTLDDYLHLLRLGRKYNFPFKARQNDKTGQLRKFISKAKMQERVAQRAAQRK